MLKFEWNIPFLHQETSRLGQHPSFLSEGWHLFGFRLNIRSIFFKCLGYGQELKQSTRRRKISAARFVYPLVGWMCGDAVRNLRTGTSGSAYLATTNPMEVPLGPIRSFSDEHRRFIADRLSLRAAV